MRAPPNRKSCSGALWFLSLTAIRRGVRAGGSMTPWKLYSRASSRLSAIVNELLVALGERPE
jgi:hypothetical protein